MTPAQQKLIDQLNALEAKATPGEWNSERITSKWDDLCIFEIGVRNDKPHTGLKSFSIVAKCLPRDKEGEQLFNSEFIVALRNAWPAISRLLKEQEEEIKSMKRFMPSGEYDGDSSPIGGFDDEF